MPNITAGPLSASAKRRSALTRLALPLCLSLAAAASLVVALTSGSVDLGLGAIFHTVAGHPPSPVAEEIIWRLRLPRALAAFACGGLLALSGVLLQVLLRNPLAEPYILGISGGASLGVLSATLLGLSLAVIHLAALGGAVASIALLLALSHGGGEWNAYRVLLTGVVLSAGFGAFISLLLSVAPAAELHGMLFWLMGDLSRASHPFTALAVLLAAWLLAAWRADSLDALAAGELKARSLGVAVQPLQYGIYFIASAATAMAVTEGGAIGFVGLIVPHLLRLLGATSHRRLLPLSLLAGGAFLTLADTAARTLAAPQQLPVGVVTALLGVPLLLFLLSRRP